MIWAGEWAADPGDDEILARAHREGRILVTLDKDFGELAVVHGQPHSGLVRLSARDQARACQGVLATHGDELTRGAIATVSCVHRRQATRNAVLLKLSEEPKVQLGKLVEAFELCRERLRNLQKNPAGWRA